MKENKTKKKRGPVRRILRAVGIVLLAVVLLLGGMIGFLSVTEYKPKDAETVDVTGTAVETLKSGADFTVMTWNVGYGALGDNADFFMDGGTSVKTADEARVNENLAGMAAAIGDVAPDVLLLQEVDVKSDRSNRINELAYFTDRMVGYTSSFANNFKVAFLPYPVPPIGKVDSGIATFSAFGVTSAERIQLPIPFTWPIRMANLKRCLLVSRIPVENSDTELVLFNLHLEAYDDGEGKRAQTEMLADLLEAERQKGNYVIAGGDFNQIFSSVDGSAYPTLPGMWTAGKIDVTAFDDSWQFLMDNAFPSCRSLDKPLKDADKENFQYYLIDGFVVSDNVTVKDFGTRDLGFVNSDHNPVVMHVTLN